MSRSASTVYSHHIQNSKSAMSLSICKFYSTKCSERKKARHAHLSIVLFLSIFCCLFLFFYVAFAFLFCYRHRTIAVHGIKHTLLKCSSNFHFTQHQSAAQHCNMTTGKLLAKCNNAYMHMNQNKSLHHNGFDRNSEFYWNFFLRLRFHRIMRYFPLWLGK